MRASFSSASARGQLAAHAALAALQLAALVWFGGASPRGFPLDDAWIHQVVARTFAESGTLGYAPGHHGAGATSYLWAALLAVNFRVVHADPAVFTLALNVVLSLAAGQLLLRLLLDADRSGGPAHVLRAALATALACVGGNFLWFAWSGMEANLLVALVLAAVWSFTSRKTPAGALGAGAACAALALTRPEAGTLAPMLALLAPRLGRSRADALRVLAPWACGVLVYFGSNWALTGTPWPATLGGRRWLWFGDARAASLVWEMAMAWLLRLRDYTLGTSATAALWLALGAAAWGVRELARRRAAGLLVVLAWTVVHLATYAVIMPGPGHGGRYQPLVPLLFLLLCAVGSTAFAADVAALLRGSAGRFARLALPIAGVAPWAGLVGVGVRDWRGDEADAVLHVERTECELGREMARLPAGAVVASFDIGCTGWAAGRPVLDLGGLTDPAVVPLMKEGRVWEYMRDHRVTHVALPLAYDDTPNVLNFAFRLNLDGNPALALEKLRELVTPLGTWLPGARATQHAAPRQGLFAVTYTGKPGYAWPPLAPKAPPLHDAERMLPNERRVREAQRALAGAGAEVEVTVASAAVALAPAQAWAAAVGPWGVAVAPPAGSPVPQGDVSQAAAELAEQFVEASDWDGAARACLHAVAIATRRFVDPAFRPRLVGLGSPERPETNTPRSTMPWGVPLVAAAFAAAAALGRAARRRERAREPQGQRSTSSRET